MNEEYDLKDMDLEDIIAGCVEDVTRVFFTEVDIKENPKGCLDIILKEDKEHGPDSNSNNNN